MPGFFNFPSDSPATSYQQGTVTIGTSPTLICTVEGNNTGVLVQNSSGAIVFLGGSNVSASGANAGYQLAISGSVTVPTYGGAACSLYGIVASTGSAITFLHPTA
jgi:hypothetical protein